MQATQTNWYVHKYETSQAYGGPEEGGWWYDYDTPIPHDSPEYMAPIKYNHEELAYAACRSLNQRERERREVECPRGYTSVLSYEEDFYTYDVSDDPYPNEPVRPHYEAANYQSHKLARVSRLYRKA